MRGPTSIGPAVAAGGENLARLKSKLRRNAAAMAALFSFGLNGASVDRLHLGLKEPYRGRRDGLEVTDALCFPLLGEGMRPLGRYAFLNLPGVTGSPVHERTWGPGPALTYRLGDFRPDATAVVACDVVDAWIAWQMARGGHPDVAFLSRSHEGGWPPEWRSPSFWSGFDRVILLPGRGSGDFLLDVAPGMGRTPLLARLPADCGALADLADGRSDTVFDGLLSSASPWEIEIPDAGGQDEGDEVGGALFAAAPLELTGGLAGGHLYYPFAVERRSVERPSRGVERVVHAYETMMVRSDGRMLTAERLPAPVGTPTDMRVLALSDGTRVREPPGLPGASSWSLSSIEAFSRWRREGGPPPFRALPDLLRDVEAFLRSRVWLPERDAHLLAAGYVLLSHVHALFDAIPLLLVIGPRASGKSELGEAIARLSLNGAVAGQLRAAGVIRFLDENRGLIVLDDMDGIGTASVVGSSELAQTLKVSYKRATARKPIADRGGRVRVANFFGPKVVSRTRPVDDVLGSRMLAIRTGAMPGDLVLGADAFEDDVLDVLRDELHCWAMASVDEVRAAYLPLAAVRSDRFEEIAAGMRAIAGLAGEGIPKRMDLVLRNSRLD